MAALTISTIPTVAQTTASIITRSNHILTDGRPQHSHREINHTQYHKGWKTCTTLNIAWLTITNQVWTQILRVYGLGNPINACRAVYTVGSMWSRVTCLALPLDAQSHAHRALVSSRSRRHQTIAIGNKQCKQINTKYNKQCLITKQVVPKDATHRYKRVSARITTIGATVKKLWRFKVNR
jgi:hypothetical protein